MRVNIAHHAPPIEVATIKPSKDWFIAYKTPKVQNGRVLSNTPPAYEKKEKRK
jgi:hypothetical protein